MVLCKDETHAQIPAKSGQCARSREISVSTRVRGGPGSLKKKLRYQRLKSMVRAKRAH
jgi:hypothetical protein